MKRLLSSFITQIYPYLFFSIGAVVYAGCVVTLVALWPRLRIVFWQLWNQQQLACGCEQLLSFSNNPLLYAGLSVIVLACVYALITIGNAMMSHWFRTGQFVRSLHVLKKTTFSHGGKEYAVRIVASSQHILFTSGVLQPVISASNHTWNTLTVQEREAALTHEVGHIRHFDIAKKYIAQAMIAPLRILPGTKQILSSLECIQECRADAFSLRTHTKYHLLSAITKMLPVHTQPATLAISAFNADETRLQQLLDDNHTTPIRLFTHNSMIVILISGIVLSGWFALTLTTHATETTTSNTINSCIQEYASRPLFSATTHQTENTLYCPSE